VLGLLVPKYGFQYFRMGDAAAVSVVLFAAAAVFAFPIWFMVTSAFKAEQEVQAIPIHWLPHDFQWFARFQVAADFAPLWRYFFNSTLLCVVHVMVTVFGAGARRWHRARSVSRRPPASLPRWWESRGWGRGRRPSTACC
jgi:ABC-type spermidine/putrescine transport system permease subunit II